MHRKIKIIKLLILFLVVYFCFSNFVLAQEKTKIEDKIIGSTFKTLVKAYVAIIDIDKFKKENIEKVKKMDEKKFNERYKKAYEVINELPANLKSQYKIDNKMSKQQAIKNIESLNKQKVYEIIDAVPDLVITGQFKNYLNKKKIQIQNSNIVKEINKFFSKFVKKTEGEKINESKKKEEDS